MLKKLILLLLIVAPVTVFAQDKIAYINAQEVFAKMPELKDVESKLATKRENIQKNATAIEAEYQKKLDDYSKTNTADLTESIIMDRQKELERLQGRYQEFIESSQAEFEKEQQSLIAPLQQKMVNAIKTVGDENGYTYILDRSTLLHVSSSAVDISAKVKSKLGIKD